ncbi:glycoside hydrolase family 88 protein [Hyalangium rubrum]|uniref:Glycoside hydrolase family 88 protein n=1 Tax=Hyalangium rubrum TaxID=3103134 RepID=A0ABU5HE67_9BACT|nr:glycoside hydrolase family 88 protein [Hyalangium sp. s54d21]MDY7231087.1 glycoside hydrolase family 88 protein [Hyalangium sp. s54d21]
MALTLAVMLGMLVAGPARAFDEAAADRALLFAQQQLARTTAQVPANQYPKASQPDGTWRLIPATDMIGWTQGFFPGALWSMYQLTGDPTWRAQAEARTRPLEIQKSNMQTHDLGFKMKLSFEPAYQATGDELYRQTLLTAAGSLASRYNPRVGIINCCDWNPNWHLPLVIDTMMNLELLLWGAQNGGQPGWRDMALNHALRTLSDLVRSNGSTYHVADYDPATGTRLFRGTFQGFANESTWARGQAWAVYGYTMVYRYTRDPRMLAAAQRVTDLYLSRLPADAVPFWDFDAPAGQQVKDSSSAAIVASALLELSNYVPDANKQLQYWNAASRMLDSLSSSAYLASGTTSPGILLHGVGNYPAGQEVDVSLIYGDYYFIEALRRFKQQPVPPSPLTWYSRFNFAEAVRELGSGNTGVRTIEFDLTPQSAPLDAVVGYADSSTTVTSFSGLAMALRMNSSGFFDVRNGGAYAAVTSVPYVANSTYHVRIAADMAARRYSVWVRPPGGAEILIANNYAFRSDAPPTDDLGKVVLKSGFVDNEFRVANHTVRGAATETWFSRQGFFASIHRLGTGNTGMRTVEFDVQPLRPSIDGVIGYADSSTTVTLRSDLAMIVHLHPSGYFEVYNGPGYSAVTRVFYAVNTTYHVRIVADMAARRYSVWVRPPGGAEILIANNYAFRSDAPLTDDLGQVSLKSGQDNDYSVANHSVRAGTFAPLSVEPTPNSGQDDTVAAAAPLAVVDAPEVPAMGCSTAGGSTALVAWGLAWLMLRTGRRSRAAARQG